MIKQKLLMIDMSNDFTVAMIAVFSLWAGYQSFSLHFLDFQHYQRKIHSKYLQQFFICFEHLQVIKIWWLFLLSESALH